MYIYVISFAKYLNVFLFQSMSLLTVVNAYSGNVVRSCVIDDIKDIMTVNLILHSLS